MAKCDRTFRRQRIKFSQHFRHVKFDFGYGQLAMQETRFALQCPEYPINIILQQEAGHLDYGDVLQRAPDLWQTFLTVVDNTALLEHLGSQVVTAHAT